MCNSISLNLSKAPIPGLTWGVNHASSRLSDDDGCRSDVPAVQAVLVVGLRRPRGYVAQGQRGAANDPHPGEETDKASAKYFNYNYDWSATSREGF